MDEFEQNQSELNNNSNSNVSFFNNQIYDYLITSAKWSKFIAIIGFIGIAFLFFGVLLILFIGPKIALEAENIGLFYYLAIIFYLIIIAILILPYLYLYKFANNITKAIYENQLSIMSIGFKNLKSYFKFNGIIMIIGIAALILYVVIAAIFFATISM